MTPPGPSNFIRDIIVEDLKTNAIVLGLCPDTDGCAGRRVFCGVVKQIEQHLLEQNRVQLKHRQIRRDLDLHLVLSEDPGRPPQRAADNFDQ